MNIGAVASKMAQGSLMEAVSTSVTKKAMDGQEAEAAALIESLKAANPAPPSGHLLDLRA